MASPRNDRLIDSPVQPCRQRHWFQIRLLPRPEPKARPPRWPVERRTAHPREKMSITLAGVEPLQTLNGSGGFRADDIPAGSAQVVFHAFYDDVRDAFETGTRFSTR